MKKLLKKLFFPSAMKKSQRRLRSSGDAREEPRVPAKDKPTGSGQEVPVELNLPREPVELSGQVGGPLNMSYC